MNLENSEAIDWHLKEHMARSVRAAIEELQTAGYSYGEVAASLMLVISTLSATWAVGHGVSREMFMEMATAGYERAKAVIPEPIGSGLPN